MTVRARAPSRAALVLGGGNVERTASSWATKSAIARYLHDLSDELGGVTWIVQQSGTWGVDLRGESHKLEGQLDPERVDVVPFDYRFSRAPMLWRMLLKQVQAHRFGVFFLPAAVPFFPIARIATRKLEQSAAYLAGDYIDAAETIGGNRWLGWSAMQRLGHIEVLRACDLVIARGKKLAFAASRYASDVHETIPLANIDFSAGKDVQPREPVPGRVLFVGVVAESKGIDVLISSVRELRESGLDVTLEVCGDGADLARCRREVEQTDLANCIRFNGWVDDARELDRAFEEASVVVMPSTTHPEGVPRVIDEAIARERPVVATTAGGVAEEFTRGEVALVRPGDRQGLTRSIQRVLTEPDYRSSLLEQARERSTWLRDSGTAGVQHARLLRAGIAEAER